MSRKYSIIGLPEPEKKCILDILYLWVFYTYEYLKFHAQPSWTWKMFYNLGARSGFCLIIKAITAGLYKETMKSIVMLC